MVFRRRDFLARAAALGLTSTLPVLGCATDGDGGGGLDGTGTDDAKPATTRRRSTKKTA